MAVQVYCLVDWHTDKSPNPKAHSRSMVSASSRKISAQRQLFISKGYRGCVGLFEGDVLNMTGSFQDHMQRKTVRAEMARRSIHEFQARYPAVNKNAVSSMRKLTINLAMQQSAWL